VSLGSPDIGMTVNPDMDVLAVLAQQLGQSPEERVAVAANSGATGREMHHFIQKDFAADDSNLFFIGAAVAVRIIVDRLRLAWTEIVDVGDVILVVVQVSAAVVVLETVPVLQLGWALVRSVEDAVLVVVWVRATVVVLETVAVFRLLRTLVASVRDAVLVVVEIGTAVLILEAVSVLRLIGAAVVLVG